MLDTIQSQGEEIDDLTGEVTSLETDLATVEGTVTTACTQLSKTTERVDALQDVLGGLSLNGTLLGLGLGTLGITMPPLPALPLGEFSC